MRRNRSSSIAANPVLIGAATVLVVLVAVFLSYNANNGLPFVPTYDLKAEVPSAANLVKGNEVRIGGARVGLVDQINPLVHRDGSVTAQLTMKLQTSVQPLPKDSTILIRPKSALGLKFVEITRGDRRGGFATGARIPLRNATPQQVEIDQVFNTFDKATRVAARRNLLEFGNAFAGRGEDINVALINLSPLLRNLIPVARLLREPKTHLTRFFAKAGALAAEVAPVAETNAALFRNLDTTFSAIASVARPYIGQALDSAPGTLDDVTTGLHAQEPFLANTQGFFADLRPGVRALRGAAPVLADALSVGIPTLKRVTLLNARLKPTFDSLRRFAQDPLVPLGIRRLTETVTTLGPTVAAITPEQTVCNYLTLWFRNVASLLSEGDRNGTWQRFIIIATPQGPNNEGGPSSAPANGPTRDNYVHNNPYPNVSGPGQIQECEAANEQYLAGRQVIGNVPGNQGSNTDKTTIDKKTR